VFICFSGGNDQIESGWENAGFPKKNSSIRERSLTGRKREMVFDHTKYEIKQNGLINAGRVFSRQQELSKFVLTLF